MQSDDIARHFNILAETIQALVAYPLFALSWRQLIKARAFQRGLIQRPTRFGRPPRRDIRAEKRRAEV